MPAKKTATAKPAATLTSAISAAALKKVAKKSPQSFVAELEEQGISSLEDLAKAVIRAAGSASRAGVAFDAEDFPICYKFTTYRPIFNRVDLDKIVNQIDKQLLR